MVVAEQLGRFETIGIDCIAMNVNDLVCVGAEPIAMLDFILCAEADPEVCGAIGEGLRAGAEQAGIEIPGGEIAQVGDVVAGWELTGSAIGLVALDAIVTGERIAAGRRADRPPLLRAPLERLHARAPAPSPTSRSTTSASAGRWATCCSSRRRSTCARCSSCWAPAWTSAGSPTSPGDGLNNLLRLSREVGYEIDSPLPGAGGVRPDPGARRGLRRGDARGLQHGPRLRLRGGGGATRTRRSSCSRPTTRATARIGAVDGTAAATVSRA